MKVVIQPVNPVFNDYVLRYVSEIEELRYEYIGEEDFGTFVFDCSADNPVGCRRWNQERHQASPTGQRHVLPSMKPYGMPTWPPLFDKDRVSSIHSALRYPQYAYPMTWQDLRSNGASHHRWGKESGRSSDATARWQYD